MSRFQGQFLGRKIGKNKGVMRQERSAKRAEAEDRNSRTPLERTKQYRLHPEKFAQEPVQ